MAKEIASVILDRDSLPLSLPVGILTKDLIPHEMRDLAGDAVDIWPINALNAPTLDCTAHPDGYCMQSSGVAYLGFTFIACEPPMAYIRYNKKGACT